MKIARFGVQMFRAQLFRLNHSGHALPITTTRFVLLDASRVQANWLFA